MTNDDDDELSIDFVVGHQPNGRDIFFAGESCGHVRYVCTVNGGAFSERTDRFEGSRLRNRCTPLLPSFLSRVVDLTT